MTARTTRQILAAAGGVGLWAGAAAGQPGGVVNGPHNLSATGPGAVRAVSEEQVCIFCHAPHNASPIRPLWNRTMPVEAYAIYTSRALDAEAGQPTGMSKMCLSCHDGTIALGAVVSRQTPIMMSGGVTTMPPGPGHIGTDLRDDHPVSFHYDDALSARDPHVRNPSLLPPGIRLDANGELQCTSCHDAHDNRFGDFLVMSNENSRLCTSCHQVGPTTVNSHQPCNACHTPHTAPSGPYLLKRATITQTCQSCHDGSHPGAADLSADLRKIFVHDTESPVDPPLPLTEHATCADCHDPHTMGSGAGVAPAVHASFGRAPGVGLSGSPVSAAAYEYEVCFRCHADGNALKQWVPRRIAQNNTRLEFSPGAISFHPVAAPGRNPSVPSLRPGWNESSAMYCTDCHNSDTGRLSGGFGPDGAHGSNSGPLLRARYSISDYTTESPQAYALCYACHDRTSILDNRSFPGHEKHIVDVKAPCAACHDAHGIASGQGTPTGNSHLINFATRMVFPDNQTGRLEFRDGGTLRGECFLRCHGRDHSPERYP